MLGIYILDVKSLLMVTLILPLLGAFCLLNISSSNRSMLKFIALNTSCITFVISLFLWVFFNKSIGSFQFVNDLLWINTSNFNSSFGIDGISLFFILLTTLLTPLCILISWNSVKVNLKEFLIAFLVMEFFLIGVFFSFRFITLLYLF